ncbi:MAG: dihydrodipicolinate synthase family protein [Ignavibacteriae bacterium]|nr:dihydrodipicolinate synthase family protein [Ignavibacteriota bacterium]
MNNIENRRFKGIWPVLITPFNDDLTIDFSGYQKMIEWYLRFKLGGIYANCQSSEMYELTEDERLKLISDAVKVVNGKIPVVGTGNFGKNLDEHIEFIKKVSDTGVEIVMLTIPEYLNTDEELEKYYLTIAEKTNIKLGIYECPVPRRYYLGIDLIKKIANTGRYFAYKETSCDLQKINSITEITNNTNFAHLQANVPYMLESVRNGTPGSMNIAANWLPDLVVEVYENGLAKNPKADVLNQVLCGMEMVQRSVHPMGVKFLISKRGVPIKPFTRYPRKLSLEEMFGLEQAAKNWFDDEGKLKILK